MVLVVRHRVSGACDLQGCHRVGAAGSAVEAVFGELNVRAIASDKPIDLPYMIPEQISDLRKRLTSHASMCVYIMH